MTDFDKLAAEIAPCNYKCSLPGGRHAQQCLAYLRPAIAALARRVDREAREECELVVLRERDDWEPGDCRQTVLDAAATAIRSTIPAPDKEV